MSLNRLRENFVVREKPVIGDIVGDAAGNEYEVTTVGLKYLGVRHIKTKVNYTMRASDAYIIRKKEQDA